MKPEDLTNVEVNLRVKTEEVKRYANHATEIIVKISLVGFLRKGF